MVDLIKPSDLAAAATVFPDDAMVVDAGGVVRRATPLQVVDAGAPAASEAVAIAGVNNTLRMTPLRTKQVLDNVTAPSVLRAAAWAESSTPPDPTNLDSQSSKSWAEDAAASAERAALFGVRQVASVAAFFALTALDPGFRYSAQDGSGAWDVLVSGTGDFVVAGRQVRVVPTGGVYNLRAFVGNEILDPVVTSRINAALRHSGTFIIDREYIVTRSTPVGDYNAALIIRESNTTIRIDDGGSIKAAQNADCVMIRTAMPSLGEVPSRLKNISVIGAGFMDGNWGEQTWVGPTGGESLPNPVYDQDGINFNEVDGAFFETTLRNVAQDGVVFASCTDAAYGQRAVVENCGKGCISFFLCGNQGGVKGRFINPNASPNPATKPIYTLSSDGYQALVCTYLPNTSWSDGRSHGCFVGPYLHASTGRCLGIQNVIGVSVVSPEMVIDGDRQFFLIAANEQGLISDCGKISIIGGSMTRINQTVAQRIGTVSAASSGDIDCYDVMISDVNVSVSSTQSSAIVFERVKGKSSVSGGRIDGQAGAAIQVDVRECDDFTMLGAKLSGNLLFGAGNIAAVVSGNTFGSPITGRANVANLVASGNRGDLTDVNITHIRAGAGIVAGAVETTTIPAPGVTAGSLVVVTNTSPTGHDKAVTSVNVGLNQITLKLFNPTTSDLVVGGGTWYFKVFNPSAALS